MSVHYEWDVETIDEAGDIVDHLFQVNYAGVVKEMADEPSKGHTKAAVLVRDDDNGRSWAYLVDGKLPEHFEDAYGEEVSKVPVRFVREVAAS